MAASGVPASGLEAGCRASLPVVFAGGASFGVAASGLGALGPAWNEGLASDPKPIAVADGGVAELEFALR